MSRAATEDADCAAIRRITAELLAAVNASDYGRLLGVWADDGVLMPPTHPAVRGRAALEDHFRAVFSARRFKFSFTFSDIKLAGDTAFERLAYSASSVGKGLHVYRRQADGAWKLALDIWNSDRPPELRTRAARLGRAPRRTS
jgi:ketosteroid isomerase-like protein